MGGPLPAGRGRPGALLLLLGLLLPVAQPGADCRDAVLLVHGNTGSPRDWAATIEALEAAGYPREAVLVPAWGSRWCAACNDHHGREGVPVREALHAALDRSCTGDVDVIAHSMGVTLAARVILEEGLQDTVDAFVGIAGAPRGLHSCGRYPWVAPTPTCGRWGLSVDSPLLRSLEGRRPGRRVYSIKSWEDAVVCGLQGCRVDGVHASRLWDETGTLDFDLGHFELPAGTAGTQVELIR